MFIPFSSTTDITFAIGGCLIFGGYIVYDTYMINRRLRPMNLSWPRSVCTLILSICRPTFHAIQPHQSRIFHAITLTFHAINHNHTNTKLLTPSNHTPTQPKAFHTHPITPMTFHAASPPHESHRPQTGSFPALVDSAVFQPTFSQNIERLEHRTFPKFKDIPPCYCSYLRIRPDTLLRLISSKLPGYSAACLKNK